MLIYKLINVLTVSVFTITSILFADDMKQTLNLMPVPAKMKLKGGRYKLKESFKISIRGNAHNRLYTSATRTLRRLAGRTGYFLPQDYITPDKEVTEANFLITCHRPGKVALHEDESYILIITSKVISLTAETDIGALRGLETFLQLLSADEDGYYFPTVEIEDEPRYPWRGLMIDAGRHFLPVDVIKRNLDAMAAVKLNVMHWHLSEDQGFRVECKSFPKLHELGSDGFYYSQAQIKDIIAYADDRGIRVMPEFDIPGHATSWLVAYPELASAPGPYTIERKWGVYDPTFNPIKEEVYDFFDIFFEEITNLFPDEYMHIGGDENNGKQWNANKEISKFKKDNNIDDNHALQKYFNQRILEILTKYNKKMVGWDEIYRPDIPKTIVIQSWRGKRALIESARRGYQAILSNGYYIDLIQPTAYHYLNDPIPMDTPLTEDEQKYILGGEATMWGEYTGPETVDSRIWPRTAAIAERYWSAVDVVDVEDMYRRLDRISFQLEELGVLHIKNVDMMMRRLTNNNCTVALRNLLNVSEPVKRYRRGRLKRHYSYAPLTRFVDAATPDAKVAREFRNLVDNYLKGDLKDEEKIDNIEKMLILWQDNHADMLITIKQSPILKEIEHLSKDLSTCGKIGLKALDYIKNIKSANKRWVKKQLEILEKTKTPRGQAELMIVSAIEELVKAANF